MSYLDFYYAQNPVKDPNALEQPSFINTQPTPVGNLPQNEAQGISLAKAGETAAVTGAATMNPYAAAVSGLAALVGQGMANKAANERHRRDVLSNAAQSQGQGEQNAYSNLMNAYKSLL